MRDSFCFLCLMKEKMSDPIYPEPNIGTLFILQINTIFSLKNSVSVSKVFPKTVWLPVSLKKHSVCL